MASKSNRPKLSHVTSKGEARMVDIGGKVPSHRRAVARAVVQLSSTAFAALKSGSSAKGDVLGVARIAGIQAAKRTPDLIPLCHPIAIASVKVDLRLDRKLHRVIITAAVGCTGPTGVEMEALTSAAVAALTLYDMLKALDKGITIGPLELLEKSGGKSGPWKKSA